MNIEDFEQKIHRLLKGKTEAQYLQYCKDVSKINTGGFKHRKLKPNMTRAYESKANKELPIVRLYEQYVILW